MSLFTGIPNRAFKIRSAFFPWIGAGGALHGGLAFPSLQARTCYFCNIDPIRRECVRREPSTAPSACWRESCGFTCARTDARPRLRSSPACDHQNHRPVGFRHDRRRSTRVSVGPILPILHPSLRIAPRLSLSLESGFAITVSWLSHRILAAAAGAPCLRLPARACSLFSPANQRHATSNPTRT